MSILHPRSLLLASACFLVTSLGLFADPLTKLLEIDFGHEVASRNLNGLATRSDGRILPGPVFIDLTGPKIADILWVLRPAGNYRFLVGSGPDGKVFEIIFNPKDNTYTSREVAKVPEAQVIAVQPLPDGSCLIGTSPVAAIYLVREGKIVSRVPLPADSVFDFIALPDGGVLASTGNPGRIYRLDLAKLAKAGKTEGKLSDKKVLADKGVTVFGEIRDRNIRRLLHLADGRIIAGSSPKGNIYAFAAGGGSPALLQENRDAEVIDLLATDDGGFYAALVHTPGEGNRLIRAKAVIEEKEKDKDEGEVRPTFGGRSTVQRFPADGFPEPVMAKAGISLYRLLVQHQGWLLMTAGEQGDTFGYDPVARRSLVYPGSDSAELNDLAPIDENRYLVLRNNAPGLGLVSFAPAEKRTLETKRLDLGAPATLGLIRLGLMHRLDPAAVRLEASTNLGSDEIEGWSAWVELTPKDEAFSAEGLRGRYVKLRLTVPAKATEFDIDKATLAYQTQNHRPQLNDFRIFPPNLALVPLPETSSPQTSTLGQMLFPTPLKDDSGEKRKGSLLGSPVIPQAGNQIIYWNVTDSDGDTLAYTLSLRAENSDTWTDLAVGIREPYLQFDLGAFPEGVYHTRLTVQEQAPRPENQRQSYTFETDALVIDRTPPDITAASVERRDDRLFVTVDGHDKTSLLEGAEFILNNGSREEVEHPADGLLDGKTERFIAEFPAAKAAGATSVEIILYDQSGNHSSRRLPLK